MDLLMKKHLNFFNRRKLSEQTQLTFIKQLYRLLTNGYSLLDALYMFQYDKRLNNLSSRLIKHLKSGMTFDEAFKKEEFHHTVTTLLYFAHLHGDLNDSLKKCIVMLEQRINAFRKFQQVIRYPIILFIFFIGLLISIKQTVLPSFINLYQSHGSVSSVLNFSIFFINIFFSSIFLLLIFILLFGLFWLFYQRKTPVEQLLQLYNKIPLLRRYMTLKISYQFAVHLSSLLKTGLSPVKVLDIMSKQQEVPIVSHLAKHAMEQLLQGFNLSEAVDSLLFMDEQFAYILRKNLNIETLEADLNMYIDMSQEKIHDRIMKTINLIQPVVLFIIASFIIFLYVTLMWPMFQLIQTI